MTTGPSADQARRLREFFLSSSYTEKFLREIFGSAVPPTYFERPKALYLTRDESLVNILIRLFFLHDVVPYRDAITYLPDWFLDYCLSTDLLSSEKNEIVSRITIVPLADYLFASDSLTTPNLSSSDFVLPASSAAARYMLDFTLRRPVASVLDLGTGCGILALFASEFSGRVVATDINRRATEYAEFNAKLNGRNNIEFLTGSLFEPVNNGRFDLILTNPPFVLAPSRQFAYRDNDMMLDEFCGMLARSAPKYLDEGGCFQMICEWVEIHDEPWHERLGRWFEDSDCDTWVLHAAPRTPEDYAQMRVAEASHSDVAGDIASYAEWMDYYRANDVCAIHSGVITMRRREGENWVRIQALSARVQGPVYEAIEDGFQARDRLDALLGEDEFLELTPRLSAHAVLEQSHERCDDKWRPRRLAVSIETGLRDEVQLDQGAVEFLTLFDGTRKISECIEILADKRGEELEEVRENSLPIVRALIERGFLELT